MTGLWKGIQYITCLPLLTIDADTDMEGGAGGNRAIGENTLVDETLTAISFIIKS